MNILLIENTDIQTQLALSTRLLSYADFLVEKGDKVSILCAESNSYKKGNIEVFGCNSSTYSGFGNLKFVFKSSTFLSKIKDVDIIHTFQPNFSSNLPVMISRIKRKSGCKVINDVRSLWIEMGIAKKNISKKKGELLSKLLYFLEKRSLKIVDYNLFITEDHKNYYEEKMKKKLTNYSIIPNAIDGSKFKIKKERKSDKVVFGYIGTLQKMRGLEEIYKVFNEIENVELHLYGHPKPTKLPKNVKYKGFRKYSEIPTVLSSFDVGLIHMENTNSSWFDIILKMNGYPRKVLEYMASSLPILASNQQINKTASEECSIFYDPENKQELKEKIILLRDNIELRNKLGKKAREIFEKKYDLSIIGNKIREIYKNLLA